ncbi:MAG: protein kinase [Myxococcales bacterium]|nr:protein kinase [Myxococcales bacterium]
MTKTEALVGGRFRLLALAGKGGMGEVHRAECRSSGRTVALKLFTSRDEETTGRFTREAEALARLKHPAIVELIAHGLTQDGTPYLAMEWLEGEDLAARLAKGPLEIEEAVELGTRVAGALAAAHAIGIVHRDIKPSNVFLLDGKVARAKLLDFGLARTQGGATFTRAGEALGTPAYMAPEQAKGLAVDARADVFSLGCVLFECITGRPPFWAEHPLAVMAKILLDDTPKLEALREGIPPRLVALVERMLAKDPAARPKDGAEVLAALQSYTKSVAPPAPIDSTPAPSSSVAARERQLLSVVFVGRVADTIASEDEVSAPTMHAEVSSGEIDSVMAAALKHGGWAERLVDGTIVITLPGKGPITDQAAAAARCALSVRRAMPTHPMALVTGRTSGRGEGFPVGEVVDRGVRLLHAELARQHAPEHEGASRGIAIDDTTAGLLDRRFSFTSVAGALVLTGDRDPRAALRTLLGKASPFVGRDRELAMLLELYDSCVSESRAAVVLVEAPAGFGKSRLRHELLRTLEARHRAPTVVVGAGDPTRAVTALGAVASAAIDLFGIREGEGAEVSRHRVRARASRHLKRDDRDRVTAFLGELVGVPFPDETHPLLPVVRADPARKGDQIRAAWEDLLRAELDAAPVVLVLEDLHAADAPSVALIDATLRAFAERPLFVLALARPEVEKTYPDLWAERALVRLNLRPLGPEASRRMVREALGEEVSALLVERIVSRGDGNAFFIEELIRAVAAGRGEGLPGTIVAMVASTLDALPPAGRRVLRAASVLGMEFTVAGLAALLKDLRDVELLSVMRDLADREIVVSPSRVDLSARSLPYSFASEIVRTAAYEQLTEEDRAALHCLAAEWLESAAGPRYALVVADHFDRAGEARRAAIWYARAAEIALGQGDFREAVERGDRGSVAGASGALLGRTRLLQSDALRHLGDNAAMLERAREAMGLLPAWTPGWWMAAANAVLGATRTGKRDIVDALAAELTADGVAPSPALARIAVYLMHVGKNEEAERALSIVRHALADPAEPAARWGWGHRANAYAAMFAGDVAGYLEHSQRAVLSFTAGGDTRELALELVGLGYARHELGLYPEAEAALEEGRRIADNLGLRHTLAAALENLGAVLHRLGKLDESERVFDEALRLFAEQKNVRMEGHCRKQLGLLLVERAEPGRAFDEIMLGSQLLSAFPPLVPATLAAGARALLALGRIDDALLMARDAASLLASRGGVEDGEAHIRLTLAEALEAAGDSTAARAAIAAARDHLLAKAAKISDADLRSTFLTAVKENAKTLELAGLWLR